GFILPAGVVWKLLRRARLHRGNRRLQSWGRLHVRSLRLIDGGLLGARRSCSFHRPREASIGFHRSPRRLRRSGTLAMRKSSISTPSATSSHVTGVDTVASGLGRTE